MGSKNVVAAIALSSTVIVLYSLFFVPEKTPVNQNLNEVKKVVDTPSIDQKETFIEIFNVKFENQNIMFNIFKGCCD